LLSSNWGGPRAMERRLAAIPMADIVGYSRLMASCEPLRTVTELFKARQTPECVHHRHDPTRILDFFNTYTSTVSRMTLARKIAALVRVALGAAKMGAGV